jgi:hypothetical protein
VEYRTDVIVFSRHFLKKTGGSAEFCNFCSIMERYKKSRTIAEIFERQSHFTAHLRVAWLNGFSEPFRETCNIISPNGFLQNQPRGVFDCESRPTTNAQSDRKYRIERNSSVERAFMETPSSNQVLSQA